MYMRTYVCIYVFIYDLITEKHMVIPVVVPHKEAAQVSKIGNLYQRLVVVTHGWQSESTATDGPKAGWRCVFFGVVAMVAVVTSPQLLDVVWCSVVVVV